MSPSLTSKDEIERVVREEWGRNLASLVKTLGDFQLAEDCLQDALISALSMEHQIFTHTDVTTYDVAEAVTDEMIQSIGVEVR